MKKQQPNFLTADEQMGAGLYLFSSSPQTGIHGNEISAYRSMMGWLQQLQIAWDMQSWLRVTCLAIQASAVIEHVQTQTQADRLQLP